MNRIIYTTIISLIACFSAMAQEERTGISIENLKTEIIGEILDLSFTVKATGLNMKCDGRYTLEFDITGSERRLVLPVITYSGKQRQRYEERRELLSDGFNIEPYAAYTGVTKKQSYRTEYRLSVPYYTWMEHASINYRAYIHDCSGNQPAAEGILVADLNPAPVYVEPAEWAPNPRIYPNLVSFLIPETEEVKARASMLELRIGFPVNVTEVRPAFENNTYELSRADSLIQKLQDSDIITLNNVHIRGYASPEGSYAANERLAKGRSESFKRYLVSRYPDNAYIRNAYTSWVPEDWEGFGRLIESGDIPAKQDVLAIVNDDEIAPDTKDRMLQRIVWWSMNYKVILKDFFPKLRRIELKVDYTVQKLSDSRARELLYINPDMLSLEEIYRVARFYEPGSRQYREVYEIAARQYPDDVIANNNAAAAYLQEGAAESAWPYLEKIRGDERSLINYGAYYYITGDPEKATEYFNRAQKAGVIQGEHNLKLIME